MSELIESTCPICGVVFGIPKERFDYLKDNGGRFYCINGHSLSYGDARVSRLLRELDGMRKDLSAQRDFNRRNRLEFAKYRARVHAGMCPYCTRTFVALSRHMKSKHGGEPLPNQKQ